MDNSNALTMEDNQVNGEKPPPRVCPRCTSENTKFCYYNNYSVSQQRYFCKNCRRYWTHGGVLRNIPIGGRCHKAKRTRIEPPSTRIEPPSVSEVHSVDIQQASHHQPFIHVQETNEFVGSFGYSASSVVVGNHYGFQPTIHNEMVTNMAPVQSFRSLEAFDFCETSFHHDYYNVGSSDLVGNPWINQSFGGYVDNHNRLNQSFNNIMNVDHNNGNTSRSIGSSSNESNINMIINNNAIRSYHWENHGL